MIISINLPETIVKKIKNDAERQLRSVSSQICMMIMDYYCEKTILKNDKKKVYQEELKI